MPQSLSARFGAHTQQKAPSTYGKLMRKRDEEEACLQEVKAQGQIYAREIYRETEPEDLRMAREAMEEVIATLEVEDKARAKSMAAFKAGIVALSKNSDAWTFNVNLRTSSDYLEPFVDNQGGKIDEFPETSMGILLSDDESLRTLLRKLDLDDAGNKDQMVWRLTQHIGVGYGMKTFFEYHLGDECNGLSMMSLVQSLDEKPKREDHYDSLEYFESTL